MIDGDSVCLDRANRFINYPFANEHQYKMGDLVIRRFQFVPDDLEGVIVEYSVKNEGTLSDIGFIFTGLVDLMPVWLSERKDIVDGRDKARYNQEHEAIIAKDQQNDWFAAFGSDRRPDFHGIGGNLCQANNQGKGTRGFLRYDLTIEKGQTEEIRFFMAGSYQSIDKLWGNYDEIKNSSKELLQNKIDRYKGIVSSSNKCNFPL